MTSRLGCDALLLCAARAIAAAQSGGGDSACTHLRLGDGPAALVLTSPGHRTIGALSTQTWTISGDDDGKEINVFSVQPFIH